MIRAPAIPLHIVDCSIQFCAEDIEGQCVDRISPVGIVRWHDRSIVLFQCTELDGISLVGIGRWSVNWRARPSRDRLIGARLRSRTGIVATIEGVVR
jgi:hypothetical protein